MCSCHWLSVFIRHVHLSSLAICKTLVGGAVQPTLATANNSLLHHLTVVHVV